MSRYEPHPWPSCTQNIIKCLIWCHENINAPRILKTSRYLANFNILTSTSHDLFDTTKPEVCSDQHGALLFCSNIYIVSRQQNQVTFSIGLFVRPQIPGPTQILTPFAWPSLAQRQELLQNPRMTVTARISQS